MKKDPIFPVTSFFQTHRTSILLLFFLILIKVATLQIMGVGGADPTESWEYAKIFPYAESIKLFHRNVRYGTILPIVLTQKLFGTSPLVYYIAPIIATVVMSFLLFRILGRFTADKTAFTSVLLLNFLPEMAKDSSHPRVSTFATLYLIITIHILFLLQDKNSEKERSNTLFIILASVSTFCMYMASESSMFVLPGLMFIVFSIRSNIKDLVLYSTTLFSFYLTETLLYFLFTPFTLGRLSVIRSHVESLDNLPMQSLLGLFYRYHPDKNDIYLTVLIFTAIIAAMYLLKKYRDNRLQAISIIIFSYLVLLTFLIKSVDPLVPFNNFRERYFMPVVPLMWCLITIAADRISVRRRGKVSAQNPNEMNTTRYYAVSGLLISIVGITLFWCLLKNHYYKNDDISCWQTNPLYLVTRYEKTIAATIEQGHPIIFKGRTSGERFIPVIEKIERYIESGMTVQEACDTFGIEVSLFEQYLEKREKTSFSGIYFYDRFFKRPGYPDLNELPHDDIVMGDRVYRAYYTSHRNDLQSIGQSPCAYIPYNPFAILAMEDPGQIESYEATEKND